MASGLRPAFTAEGHSPVCESDETYFEPSVSPYGMKTSYATEWQIRDGMQIAFTSHPKNILDIDFQCSVSLLQI